MSSLQPINNLAFAPWELALNNAAAAFNGGPRSFPFLCDRDVANNYAYEPPNEDYKRLLAGQVHARQGHGNDHASPRSAGWLVPDQESVCRPVLVAHSLLAALWLIKETLPCSAMPQSAWQQLVDAAQAHAADAPSPRSPPAASPPPSAQKSPASLSLLKRAVDATPSRAHLKRPRRSTAGPPSSRLTPPRASSPSLPRSMSPDSELAATPQLTAPPAANEPAAITSISNNNRRADRAREQRQEKAQAKQRLEAGLIAPPANASVQEQSAYQLIRPADEQHVSWLFKHPVNKDTDLFSSVTTPYLLAATMIKNARSVGNSSSQKSAAAFLRGWRAQGTPFAQDLNRDADPTALSSVRGPSLPATSTTEALAAAWTLCERYDQELNAIHIKYRWAMAYLGKTYTDRVEEIHSREEHARPAKGASKGRGGKGKVSTEVIDELLSSFSLAPNPQHRQRFTRRLYRALRWYDAASQLGWGMLCLMPHDTISNSWVENDLRVRVWHIWLELVGKVNPAAHEASQALQRWLGSEALSGGPISEKETLYIEAASDSLLLATPTQITEVADSEGENAGSDQESSCALVPALSCSMRQRTLLELFQPQASV